MSLAELWGSAVGFMLAAHRDVYLGLAGELRGLGHGWPGIPVTAMAFLLGLLHALTPGHGKSVVVVYFLGRVARPLAGIGFGLQIALVHVAAGVLAFLAIRLALGITIGATAGGLGSGLRLASHALVALVGLWLFLQAAHGQSDAPAGPRTALPVAIGLLPCPLTLLVLGYAVANATLTAGILLVAAMAIGIAATLGTLGLLSIVARRPLVAWLGADGARLERATRPLAAGSALVIAGIGAAFFLQELLTPRAGMFR